MRLNKHYVFYDVVHDEIIVATKIKNPSIFKYTKYSYLCQDCDCIICGWSFESNMETLEDEDYIMLGEL
jgi:hypothetical protein